MKKVNLTTILIFLLVLYSGWVTGVYVENKDAQPVQVEEVVITDELPLTNGGEIFIRLEGKYKVVYMSYEDFAYVTNRKTKIKKIAEKVNGLFLRMKDDNN